MVRVPDVAEGLLSATGLGKGYALSRSRLRPLLRELWRGRAGATSRVGLWALRDVSFELAHGSSLGVVGRNGAGKSTLLRLLAGTARPTTGEVVVRGRLGCLLELGTGFHALETGRQNAETWLVLLGGKTRAEARALTASVERFAGIGAYFDRPLRTYSAGMQLRVAFATAAMLDPDILVADEVVSVGDEEFQRKCNRFFDDFLARGGSLVLCTHDLWQVQRLCDRTLWLDEGRPRALGETREVVRRYREDAGSAVPDPDDGSSIDAGRRHAVGETAGLAFEVVDLHLLGPDGAEVREIDEGTTVTVVADLLAPAAVPHVHLSFTGADLTPVYGVSSDMEEVAPVALGDHRYRFQLTFPELALAPGRYRLRAHALDETATRLYDTVEIPFAVRGTPEGPGLVRIAATWH